MSFLESLERLNKNPHLPITTDLMFKPESPGFIRRNDKVLIVGPGVQLLLPLSKIGVPMDRSLMVLPAYLRQGKGKITVLDAPDDTEEDLGAHSLALIQNWFKSLPSHGLPRYPINYVNGLLLKEDYAFSERFNVVIDHLTTSNYLLDQANREQAEAIARQVSHLYSNFLEKDGKVILHYDRYPRYPYREKSLIESLKKDFKRVTNITQFVDIYQLPPSLQQYFHSTNYFFANMDDQGRIPPAFSSEGVLIAQKLR